MALNRETGEPLGDMGVGRIVPLSKWADTMFFERACEIAGESFRKAGAILPIVFEPSAILVQEYQNLNRGREVEDMLQTDDALAFIFARVIRGEEYFANHVFWLRPEMIGELVTLGKWKRDEGGTNNGGLSQ